MSDALEHALLDAVASGCALARRLQRGRLRATSKADSSPVTIADFAVQALIGLAFADVLGAANVRLAGEESLAMLNDPTHRAVRDAVIAEVQRVRPEVSADAVLAAIDLGTATGGDDFWTVDPIDGTTGFVRGDQYSIALARLRRGEVIFAILGCPNVSPDGLYDRLPPGESEGVILVAELGGGCWQRPDTSPRERGTRLQRHPLGDIGPVVAAASMNLDAPTQRLRDELTSFLGARVIRRSIDSQVKYGLLARGEVDIYLRPQRQGHPFEHIWDHAAGSLVATEAGACVFDFDGQALDFSHGRNLLRNRGIVGCAADLRGPLQSAIRASVAASG